MEFVDAVKFQMPKRLSGKQVLELLFALPSSDSDSDVEADDGASEELLHLDTENNSGLASSDPGLPQIRDLRIVFCIRIESRIESAVRFDFESNFRIEVISLVRKQLSADDSCLHFTGNI